MLIGPNVTGSQKRQPMAGLSEQTPNYAHGGSSNVTKQGSSSLNAVRKPITHLKLLLYPQGENSS